MLEKIKVIFTEVIMLPIKKNVTLVLIVLGISLTILSKFNIFNIEIVNINELIFEFGKTILGAGVFAVILKSVQFTEIFQRHIYDVFYNPEKINTLEDLKKRWSVLTDKILGTVLPRSHQNATSYIDENFFNSELEYHFENHTMQYEIKIDKQTLQSEVISRTTTNIVLAPLCEDPTFKQTFTANGESKITELSINNENFSDFKFEKDRDNSKKQILSIPLKNYAKTCTTKDNDCSIKMERTVLMKQNLKDEPYILVEISRYTKSFTLKAKISDGFMLHFVPFGVHKNISRESFKDGFGYNTWIIAKQEELLFPKQGFMLVIVENDRKEGY